MDELAKSLPEEVAAVQGWLARELSTPAVLAQRAALLVRPAGTRPRRAPAPLGARLACQAGQWQPA